MLRFAQDFSLITLLSFSLTACFARTQGAVPERPQASSFQLKSGDRVVFLGDSLTASRGYTDLVELYARLTYPDRNIKFFNAGIGGDTAQGGLKRLDRDVLLHRPTVVTVCFGINDIGWGGLADAEHIQAYYDGMRGIIKGCQDAGARVIILGPCTTALPKVSRPGKNVLQTMSEKVRAMADGMGAQTIDLWDQMHAVQMKIRADGKEKDFPTHAGDSIHLADVGNIAFASILLKGLGAPDLVSSLEIDAQDLQVVEATRCSVTKLKREGKGIQFVRKDKGWPVNIGAQAFGAAAYLPTHETLAKYTIKVTGLHERQAYDILVNGKQLTTVSGSELARGHNLIPAVAAIFGPTPPWAAQAASASALVKARTELTSTLWLTTIIAAPKTKKGVVVTDEGKPAQPREIVAVQSDVQNCIKRIDKTLKALSPTKPVVFSIVPASKEKH